MCETLREPVKVLKSLSEQAINKQYKFKRLYRNLYNPEFYFLAYKNISQSQGSMTPGVDGKSLDGMSEKRINALIESLKDFSYQPNPARRVYIEKKNSTKKRPLGIPSTEDKLVQEVAKMILESIYEPNVDQHIIIWHFRRIKLCRNNAGIFHPRTPGILVITVIEKIITVITRLKMGYFNFPDSANYGIK